MSSSIPQTDSPNASTIRSPTLSAGGIRQMLDALAARDAAIAAAVARYGYPPPREREAGFDALLRIIIGQQLSTRAAATITGRVTELLGGTLTAAGFAAAEPTALRAAGLSQQKINYGLGLSERVLTGQLDPVGLGHLSDAEVEAQLTALKGFGRWSAHMYLMFSLGRTDIWPAGDLAVRGGVARMLDLPDRPTEPVIDAVGARWKPYRSVVALLAWQVYSAPPLD